jgi:tetratricopeptide (TPR) repeat protein
VSWISSASNVAAICTYSGNHSARIVGYGTRYISKWGYAPIVNHPPTEVPLYYGSVNAYYKINPAYRPIGSGDPVGRDWETISNALSGITSGSLIKILSGGTYSESPTLTTDNIIIDGLDKSETTINGELTLQNVDDCEIKNLTVNDEIHINYGIGNVIYGVETNERIVCDYGDEHEFRIIDADHGDKYALDIYDSDDLYIAHLNSEGSSKYAVYATTYSYFWLDDTPNFNLDRISNKTYAVQVGGYSDAYLYEIKFEDNSYDIWAASGCYVYAECCDITGSTYGNVEIEDEGCYGEEQVLTPPSVDSELQIGSNNSNFDESLDLFRILREEKRNDKSSVMTNVSMYQMVIDMFKSIVSDYSNPLLANRSLPYIVRCYKDIKEPDKATSYLYSLVNDTKYDGELKYNAKMLLASLNVRNGEYDKAIQQYNENLTDCSIEEIVVGALYGKGVIYSAFLNDKEKAAASFQELIKSYPDHPRALSAAAELDRLNKEFYRPEENELIPSEFAIDNYPNPFNPTTEIRFTLPEDGHVILKIYDIQGKLVNTPINENQNEGVHVIHWDGKNNNGLALASGTYFYQIIFKDKVLNRKMLLLR